MRLDLLASQPHYRAHLAPLAGHSEATEVSPDGELTAPVTVVASWADHQLARRMHAERIVVMEHGIGQSYDGHHPSYPGGWGRGDARLFLVPNETAAERWRQQYPLNPVRVIGSPRLDTLPRREEGDGPRIAFAFHWRCAVGWGTAVDEYRTAVAGFARVWSREVSPEAVPGVSVAPRPLGHGHPRIMPELERFYETHGLEPVRDFNEVCRRADLLVADNTSVLYEFASTGRPVVVLNSRKWDRKIEYGLRFWSASQVGVNVNEPDELVPAILRALSDPPEVRAARDAALDIVYTYRSGAALRAVQAIEEVI